MKDTIIKTLHERRLLLENTIETLRKREYSVEGSFSTKTIRGRTVIYRKIPSVPGNGEYLGKDKLDIASALAEKDQDERMLIAAIGELTCLERAISILENSPSIDEVYTNLTPVQQQLIRNSNIDYEYAKEWESVEYIGNSIRSTYQFTTLKGEVVKSKSEKMIADCLFVEGIPYRYEYPLKVKGWKTKYPDFTILNVRTREEIIWEHFGMMDDPVYCEDALNRMEFYYKNGYSLKKNLIITQESSKKPFDPGFWTQKLIKEYLK